MTVVFDVCPEQRPWMAFAIEDGSVRTLVKGVRRLALTRHLCAGVGSNESFRDPDKRHLRYSLEELGC